MVSLRCLPGLRRSFALVLVLSWGHAYGDVTLEEQVRLEGEGLMRMFNMTTRTVTTISGERARTDTDMQMDSRLMRAFGGSGQTASIVRLDEEKIYELDLRKKTYTQTTLAEQRAEMQRAMEQMREAQQTQQQGASGIDEADCDWSEATATSERTGESESIAGMRAERLKVVASQSCRDRKSEQVCDFRLTLDQWLAPDAAAAEEALNYYRAYAEKLDLGAVGSRDYAQRVESMFGGYTGVWGKVATHLAAAEGYPVRSTVALAIGGPQCHSPQQAASERPATPGVGEVIGGALGGTLGGMLGRNRDSARKSAPEPEPAVAISADGMIDIMRIKTEVLSIGNQAADPAVFELPAKFKLAR
jgi:hypothetical protein